MNDEREIDMSRYNNNNNNIKKIIAHRITKEKIKSPNENEIRDKR